MYRHKDRYLKSKRLNKKKNINKESKKYSQDYKNDYLAFGSTKAKQLILIKEHGIKVHKNKLRYFSYSDIPDHIKNNPIGNTTIGKLESVLETIKDEDIPRESNFQHDITRWKVSKEKTKKMKKKRLAKQLRNNI
tara:strand:- start:763 stop:1167 length:405 start_codon:yes stop_codon:yes gene_type:complete